MSSPPAILRLPGRRAAIRSSGASAHARGRALGGLLEAVGVVAAGTLLVAAGLTANLVALDPGDFSLAELTDLSLALGWVAFATNAGFAALLLAAWPVLRRLRPGWVGSRASFLVAGLPALHLAWVLLNRLPRVQLLFFEPVFVTPAGLAEATLVSLSALGVAAALLAFGRRAFGTGAIAATGAALLVVAVLQWNGRDERMFRTYPMERVRAAAAHALETAPPPIAPAPAPASSGATGSPPVIVLALDGWGWDVIVPLLEAGRLPNTAALVAQGAAGYLDNGDDSYSPRIWNTVFTGRSAEEHGVHDFFVMRLSRSGRTIANLASQTPAIDSFYGLKQLIRKLPSLGLWQLVATTSHDVAVKPVWSIASDYERRVVVANALNTVPALPVNGAIFTLQGDEPGASAFHPADLAGRWQPHPTRATGKRSLAAWGDALASETTFTLSLFEENDVELGVYYTNAVDRLAHRNWDFHARDRLLVTRLPDSLPDAEWESFVARHADESLFGAYAEIDEQIGRFRSAYPDATFVVLSDHGWTFSGYSHYGSQDGIVLVSGPRARAGATIPSARVRDVAPTLLALLGIPLSDELSGEILREALAETPRVGRVASYGAPGAPGERGTRLAGPLDAETLRELAALGYAR